MHAKLTSPQRNVRFGPRNLKYETVCNRPICRHTVRARASRLCDELLNETLFMSLTHVWVEIAAWLEDYNRGRPHSALGYATPAAFAAELD